MDMAQSHIVESRRQKLFFLNRNMLLVPAMGKKDVISRFVQRPHLVIERLFNLSVFITQAINPGIQCFYVYDIHLLLTEKVHIIHPRKIPVIRTFSDVIMISGHHYHLDWRYGFQTVIQLLQLPFRRRPVENIPRDQYQINPLPSGFFQKSVKGRFNLFRALLGPGFSSVGNRSHMNIRHMDKSHLTHLVSDDIPYRVYHSSFLCFASNKRL